MRGVTARILYYALHITGFVLLYLVLRKFDWESFLGLFSSFRIQDFALGFTMLLIVYLLKTYRWQRINRSFGIHISYGTTLIYFLVSGFLSVITPGRLGEFARIFFIRNKTGVSTMLASSSVILDRVWDVLILSLLGGAGAVMIFGRFQMNILSILLIAVIFILALLLIIFPTFLFKPLLYLTRKKEKWNTEIDAIYKNWRFNVKRLFLPGFLTTLIAFIALAVIPLIFTSRLEQEVGMIPSISAVSISNMLAFLPITIAGFGTRELVFTEIWKILDYTAESAITISTAYFICNYLGSLVVGGLTYAVWFRKHFRLKEIRNAGS
ncbi:lysylphosphatidylglycerol synthase transmembrane domain-containing protein [Bacteroidota bacterium]